MARLQRWVALVTLLLLQSVVAAAAVTVHRSPPDLAELGLGREEPAPVVQPPVVKAAPVLEGGVAGAVPDKSVLARRLGPIMGDARLGGRVAAMVADVNSGRTLYARRPDSGATPASTTKLVTAVAVLATAGPDERLTTRVVQGSKPNSIVLVGGGDPTLSGPDAPKRGYPRRARLADLAAKTAEALPKARRKKKVKVYYDDTLFSGPVEGPGWKPNYIPDGNVAPITALAMDEGRLYPASSTNRKRTTDPPGHAARAFADLLREKGVKAADPVRRAAPSDATELARVSSPPISALVEHMMTESDNDVAEALARLVALRTGAPGSFDGASAAVRTALDRLGAADGVEVYDGSGLSPRNRLTPKALTKLLMTAAAPEHPNLRSVISGMPVAGFTGTLDDRFADGDGAGAVRAKTGTLSGVHTLAGVARTSHGRLLAFAFLADRARGDAPQALDDLAAALATCGCE